jgi:hypothetical protein
MRRTSSQHAAVMAENRAAEEQAYRALYGNHRADVDLLRRRGFVVTREGEGFRVGNKVVTAAELIAVADRERRLVGADASPQPVAMPAALKVGDKVALAPRPAKTAGAPPPDHSSRALNQRATGAGDTAANKAVPAGSTASEGRSQPPLIARQLSGAAATAREKAQEYSAELGDRPRVVWLGLELLSVDEHYQREIGTAGRAHIHRILRGWNWNRYQPIVVNERADGTYAVIDGQHRLAAARLHPLIDELPCYIVSVPDMAAEAAIFADVNTRRLALTSQQKFYASLAAGEGWALNVSRICERAGVRMLRAPPSGAIPPLSILAPYTLQKILQQIGAGPLETALRLIAEAHPTADNAFRSPTIMAVARIAADREFSRSRLAAVLARADVAQLYEDMRLERITGGGTLEAAAERVLRRRYQRTKAT